MAKLLWVGIVIVVMVIAWFGCRKAGKSLTAKIYASKVSLSYEKKLKQNSQYQCGFYGYLDQALTSQEMSSALMTIADDLGYVLLTLLMVASGAVILVLDMGGVPFWMIVMLSACWIVMLVVDIARAWHDVILATLVKADAAGETQAGQMTGE